MVELIRELTRHFYIDFCRKLKKKLFLLSLTDYRLPDKVINPKIEIEIDVLNKTKWKKFIPTFNQFKHNKR